MIPILNVKCIVFDLDDTLYEEITYVQSGFKAVSTYLYTYHNIDQKYSEQKMYELMESFGRGQVFNLLLLDLNLFTKKRVQKCLNVYRSHVPNIHLSRITIDLLEKLRYHYPLYIVTDGNKMVQKKKSDALNLSQYAKKVFITHQYGRKYSKPSPFCFMEICKLEKLLPSEVVYIGDNPNKDFVNIKKIGFRTIRIQQGMFQSLQLDQKYEAEYTVSSINELSTIFTKYNLTSKKES